MKTFAVLAGLLTATPALAQMPPALKDLKLEIPATKYVLKNGLTLIVHEDHKAPIVAVQIWYKVGSRDEPAGRSGFAHLFEHLMFNGSEHSDTDWFKPARAIGATAINGTTNNDRTNYFQTVPTGALEPILWLESDRMGHFLGAVSQAKLDEQRGVVQNEKRQGQNRPYGKTDELITQATWPANHPYAHTTIGSMEDLDAAKLEDVQAWFRAWYGPSNAILVLSGDVTPADALAKVERAFGDIPPGPPVSRAKVWVAKRTGEQRAVDVDLVAQPRLTKVWNVPQAGDRDTALLTLVADTLTGGRTSRLYKRLVHDEQTASNVYAYVDENEIASQFFLTAEIKPDADIAKVEAAMDEELAAVMKTGPSKAELDRARTARAGELARSLESAFMKSWILVGAESQYGDPSQWRRSFDLRLQATPADVQAVARKWLSDGVYVLTTLPRPALSTAVAGADRSRMPAPAATPAQGLPAFERVNLANGLTLIVAPRHDAPMVNMTMAFETGFSTEDAGLPAGAAALTSDLMDEGTISRTGLALNDALRGLGAELSVNGDEERASVSLNTLAATLDPALELFADVVLHPAFREEDVARERKQAIVDLERTRRQPQAAGSRAIRPLLFGAAHPYGRIATEASLAAFTREDAAAYHRRWFTPDHATLVVVGDTTMAAVRPKIEAAFAGWQKSAVKRNAVPDAPGPRPGVFVIDRPGSQQSVILGAAAAPRWNAQDEIATTLLNDAFGGTFTSRLNMNLREAKGWSYGVRSYLAYDGRGPRLYEVFAPVQTDKTAESLLELKREIADLATTRPLTPGELETVKNDTTVALPGRWETMGAVSGALTTLAYRGLPDDYWSTYESRVKATSAAEVAAAAAKIVRPKDVTWVIVGDAARIMPELEKRGLGPVVRVTADGALAK